MDKRKIIKEKFYPIFCEINSMEKKYAEVWLSFADFGRVYFSDEVYELKVKMRQGVERNYVEIDEIIDILHEKAKDELESILAVRVINSDERKHCKRKDVMVYCEEAN